MQDPVVWYTLNAQIDGIDTASDDPRARLKFLIYQRRLLLSVMRDKALMMAAINGGGEQAQKLMQEYIALQIPTDPEIKRLQDYRFERTLDEIDKMGPIPIGSFKMGSPIGHSDDVPVGSFKSVTPPQHSDNKTGSFKKVVPPKHSEDS